MLTGLSGLVRSIWDRSRQVGEVSGQSSPCDVTGRPRLPSFIHACAHARRINSTLSGTTMRWTTDRKRQSIRQQGNREYQTPLPIWCCRLVGQFECTHMCCPLLSYTPFSCRLFMAIMCNMTSSIKPEVHIVSQRRQWRIGKMAVADMPKNLWRLDT